LAYALQFSLRGTPVLRYGEELGMGEDLSLNGRDAIRTPMQWSSAPNGGFTTADDAVRPVISGGEYGYEQLNVVAQQQDPGSLLSWFERMIRILRESPEIGLGECRLVDAPVPRHVIAHCAAQPGRGSMVFVHNLADQEVTVDLSQLRQEAENAYEMLADREYAPVDDGLSKIRPAFPKFGDRSTGGNSSQVTDGAAAIVLMKRSKAQQLGQPILAKFVGATVAGVPPRIMGIGPSVAIPKLMTKYGLDVNKDIDLIEINEAFASMAVYCKDILGLDHSKLNVRGGAIALGHPLGATGARQIVTGLSECRRQNKRILLTSMCIGTGQGMAGLFVNEQ